MDEFQAPAPLSLEDFHREAESLPDLAVRVLSMPDLLARFLSRPPGPGYETRPAQPFCARDFSRPFLTEEELARLNQFKVLKKQVEWVCGRFAVKTLVRDILMPGRALTEIRMGYRSQGAPYLESLEDHSLSLSHSSGLTAAALSLSPAQVVGIDIEAMGPMPDTPFMTTAFTQKEIQAMAPCPEAVFQCWTLKEAYLKFIGKGFNESLHHVEVLGHAIEHRGVTQKVTCRSWLLETGHMLGLVIGRAGSPG